MLRHLGDFELETLRKLANGESVSLSSHLRLRLEMAGVIQDGPRGIVLTGVGRRLANEKRDVAVSSPLPEPKFVRDRRGRRLPFQRKSVF